MFTYDKIGPLNFLQPRSRRLLLAHAHEQHVSRGRKLYDEGQAADGVHLLVAGRIEMVRSRCNGRLRTVCVRVPGDLFCCLPMLDGGPYPAASLAAEDSLVLKLPMPVFREHLAAQPDFLFAVHRHLAARLRHHGCDRQMAQGSAGSRLAACLADLASQFGADLPLCRRVLADMAGTALETAIREVKGFERAGWVTLERGRVHILDAPALRERAAAGDEDPLSRPAPETSSPAPARRAATRTPPTKEVHSRRITGRSPRGPGSRNPTASTR